MTAVWYTECISMLSAQVHSTKPLQLRRRRVQFSPNCLFISRLASLVKPTKVYRSLRDHHKLWISVILHLPETFLVLTLVILTSRCTTSLLEVIYMAITTTGSTWKMTGHSSVSHPKPSFLMACTLNLWMSVGMEMSTGFLGYVVCVGGSLSGRDSGRIHLH